MVLSDDCVALSGWLCIRDDERMKYCTIERTFPRTALGLKVRPMASENAAESSAMKWTSVMDKHELYERQKYRN